tara:strand:- start:932 stop:1045 length:114 start_codon:yes stop_codon:yes gene_type:complete
VRFIASSEARNRAERTGVHVRENPTYLYFLKKLKPER